MSEYQEEFNKIFKEKSVSFLDKWSNVPKNTARMSDFERLITLGRGAFGRVFLVKKVGSEQYYAMKVLSKSEIIHSKQVTNALNEKRILSSVSFPFILKLAYSFKDNSYLYMVLEFVVGGEIFSLLRNMRKFPENMVKFYSAQVILAFEYLHYFNIAYRDLKPENLLLHSDGYIRVADLGFAKMIPKDRRTWTLCGTPDYMAPEIILNKGYHTAVDWWAVGVLLYEMTCGYPPFMHNDQMKTFELIISGKFKFNNAFNHELKDLIRNLVQVDLSRRFGNLKNGVLDIKNHAYFKDMNWLEIYYQKVLPPYRPIVKHPADTSNFDRWEEEVLFVADKDKYFKEFEDF